MLPFSICVIFSTLTIAVYATYQYFLARRRRVHHATLPTIINMLNPPDTPLAHLLSMRSVPNARLRSAFRLSNTFVTEDPVVHSAFVKKAKSLIRTTPTGWFDVAQCATTVIHNTVADTTLPHDIPYHIFIQVITFKAVISSLFKVDTSNISYHDIELVTSGINKLWQLSKTSASGDPELLFSINARLRGWIPELENPLDFIIPTFETMWRVVAVTTALVHSDNNARQTLAEYLRNPSHSQFVEWVDDSPSVDSLITESLRLHPPTRRISRAIPFISPKVFSLIPHFLRPYFTQTAIADVGTLHQSSNIWGPDIHTFDAMRHHPAKLAGLGEDGVKDRENGMLAFGYGPLRCVAYTWAPRFVGVLVAAVFESEGSGIEIVEGEKIGGREGWDSWKVLVKGCTTA